MNHYTSLTSSRLQKFPDVSIDGSRISAWLDVAIDDSSPRLIYAKGNLPAVRRMFEMQVEEI